MEDHFHPHRLDLMLTRCPRCGDIFSKVRVDICPKCRQEETQRIDTLSKYLDANPEATIDDLERVSGMPKEVILTYAREGRLVALDIAILKVRCEDCGVDIPSGRFCPSCRKKLAAKFSEGIHQIKDHRSHKKP